MVDETQQQQQPSTTADTACVIKDGFLTKQGGKVKTWKRRWFVLKSDSLDYYKSESSISSSPLGSISMKSILRVERGTLTKEKEFNFNVVTAPRTYIMFSGSEFDMQEWMNLIEQTRNGRGDCDDSGYGGDSGGATPKEEEATEPPVQKNDGVMVTPAVVNTDSENTSEKDEEDVSKVKEAENVETEANSHGVEDTNNADVREDTKEETTVVVKEKDVQVETTVINNTSNEEDIKPSVHFEDAQEDTEPTEEAPLVNENENVTNVDEEDTKEDTEPAVEAPTVNVEETEENTEPAVEDHVGESDITETAINIKEDTTETIKATEDTEEEGTTVNKDKVEAEVKEIGNASINAEDKENVSENIQVAEVSSDTNEKAIVHADVDIAAVVLPAKQSCVDSKSTTELSTDKIEEMFADVDALFDGL